MNNSSKRALAFRLQWKLWKILGASSDGAKWKYLYWLYCLFLNTIFTIYFPLHLILAISETQNLKELLELITVWVTTVACSIKFFALIMNFKKVYLIRKTFSILDNSVHDTDELKELDKTNRRARIVEGVFISVFTLTVLTASITAFGSKTPKLLYMGWFPFNWRNSRFLCNIGNAYQIIAIIYYISINFANDTFVATALCILHGHIKILGKRISKIGEKDKSENYNEQQLKFCIEIQKVLYLLCDRIQLVVSLTMLVQFTVNATNICLNLAIMLYFSTDNINRIFYFFYLFASSLQTFPACYYGSKVERGFEQLRHAAFQSDWIQQNRNYKTCMIIFTERVLKKRTLIAGRLLPIHLDTFFSICKGAYSMLAMIIKLKK